jgi:hypothetical protein
VYNEVKTEYLAADRSQQYRVLVSGLRSQAVIIYANGTRLLPDQPSAIIAPDEELNVTEPSAQNPPEPVVEQNVTETIINVTEPTNQTLPTDHEAVRNETVANVTVPEPSVINENTEPAPTTNTESIFGCIARKSTLYGASWNTDSQEARKLFAKQNVNLRYVECTNNKECSWIKGYPTWVIGDREYIGRMSVEQLKDAADC